MAYDLIDSANREFTTPVLGLKILTVHSMHDLTQVCLSSYLTLAKEVCLVKRNQQLNFL